MTTIELRRLNLADLSGIEEIERLSYPTPWSRSMFAGELAKPSSLCLGAFDVQDEDGRLCGYLIVSRYVDAWHVMNIAVHPDHRGHGIATMLLERLFALTADDERRGYTLEVQRLERDGDPAVRAARLPGTRHQARLLHGQPRGRTDHVEGSGRARRARLGSCRRCETASASAVARLGPIPGTESQFSGPAVTTFATVPNRSSRAWADLVEMPGTAASIASSASSSGGRCA